MRKFQRDPLGRQLDDAARIQNHRGIIINQKLSGCGQQASVSGLSGCKMMGFVLPFNSSLQIFQL